MTETYAVKTNLDPAALTELGLAVYEAWVRFALGLDSLGGRKLLNPTGKYASAIQFRQEGEATVAIFVDDESAPEARWLEEGHGAIDLKDKLRAGKVYKMHNERTSTQEQMAGAGLRKRTTSGVGSSQQVWTEIRTRESTGYARMGQAGTMDADAWVIPPMVAYAPAKILAGLLSETAGLTGSMFYGES